MGFTVSAGQQSESKHSQTLKEKRKGQDGVKKSSGWGATTANAKFRPRGRPGDPDQRIWDTCWLNVGSKVHKYIARKRDKRIFAPLIGQKIITGNSLLCWDETEQLWTQIECWLLHSSSRHVMKTRTCRWTHRNTRWPSLMCYDVFTASVWFTTANATRSVPDESVDLQFAFCLVQDECRWTKTSSSNVLCALVWTQVWLVRSDT